jgi:hypothetical protein
VKIPTDPDFGPLLSLVVLLLALSIGFLVLTLPFSAFLRIDPAVIGSVIPALGTVLGGVLYARGKGRGQ